jgi:hypothetical protein
VKRLFLLFLPRFYHCHFSTLLTGKNNAQHFSGSFEKFGFYRPQKAEWVMLYGYKSADFSLKRFFDFIRADRDGGANSVGPRQLEVDDLEAQAVK